MAVEEDIVKSPVVPTIKRSLSVLPDRVDIRYAAGIVDSQSRPLGDNLFRIPGRARALAAVRTEHQTGGRFYRGDGCRRRRLKEFAIPRVVVVVVVERIGRLDRADQRSALPWARRGVVVTGIEAGVDAGAGTDIDGIVLNVRLDQRHPGVDVPVAAVCGIL